VSGLTCRVVLGSLKILRDREAWVALLEVEDRDNSSGERGAIVFGLLRASDRWQNHRHEKCEDAKGLRHMLSIGDRVRRTSRIDRVERK